MDKNDPVLYIYELLSNQEELSAWTDIDEAICYIEWLDDLQTYTEVKVILEKHGNSKLVCFKKHSDTKCMVPIFVDAVNIILKDYQNTRIMNPKYRYLLQYFLALESVGYIVPKD